MKKQLHTEHKGKIDMTNYRVCQETLRLLNKGVINFDTHPQLKSQYEKLINKNN